MSSPAQPGAGADYHHREVIHRNRVHVYQKEMALFLDHESVHIPMY